MDFSPQQTDGSCLLEGAVTKPQTVREQQRGKRVERLFDKIDFLFLSFLCIMNVWEELQTRLWNFYFVFLLDFIYLRNFCGATNDVTASSFVIFKNSLDVRRHVTFDILKLSSAVCWAPPSEHNNNNKKNWTQKLDTYRRCVLLHHMATRWEHYFFHLYPMKHPDEENRCFISVRIKTFCFRFAFRFSVY